MAHYVVEVVEGLDLSELERAGAGRGSPPDHLATLLSLLMYALFSAVSLQKSVRESDGDGSQMWRSAAAQ